MYFHYDDCHPIKNGHVALSDWAIVSNKVVSHKGPKCQNVRGLLNLLNWK